MRVAVVSQWFSENMGYIENLLPRALVREGAHALVISSTARTYFSSPIYRESYESFLGPSITGEGRFQLEPDLELVRLPFRFPRGRIALKHLGRALDSFAPDVVQVLDHASLISLQIAARRALGGARFFSANHIHRSVVESTPSRASITWLAGRLASIPMEKCYAISHDAAEVASEVLGVPRRKIVISQLGVDTDTFRPRIGADDKARRQERRSSLRIEEGDLVCIYTGRLTHDKGPLLIAEAIERLRNEGRKYVGLFVGSGPQETRICAHDNCIVTGFVPYKELGDLYRAADVGVWPRQESTSMLDASACGLPVVISDRVVAPERVDQIGLTYEEGSPESLASTLRSLARDEFRVSMGEKGAKRMTESFSWQTIARSRLRDYEAALRT